MNHAGIENGNLAAPYNQLSDFGLGRRFIPEAIREAEARRLVTTYRGGKRNQVADHMSRYELTWLAAKRIGPAGHYWVEASNDWKAVTKHQIDQYLSEKKKRKNRHSSAPMVNLNGTPVVNLDGTPIVNLTT